MADVNVLILGGGTGGYEAALRASELGLATVVVERDKLGGTCLHRGCIPSKALLRTAEVMALTRDAAAFGVEVDGTRLDYEQAHRRKDAIVAQLFRGVEGLVKRSGVTVLKGVGTLVPPSIFAPAGAVSVQTEDGERELISPDHIIIATGSTPRALPGLPFDGVHVLSSDDALELTTLPSRILIVGAGAIGCEWASLYADLGVKVTLLEAKDQILPLEDGEIGRTLARVFERRGVAIWTGARLNGESYEETADGIRISAHLGDRAQVLEADAVLVAIGRAPVVEGFGLENLPKVRLEGGAIAVDGYCRTDDPHVFALGDVIGGLQLAHVAVHEGLIAVETIAGLNPEPRDDVRMPRCTYSRPEVSSVGLTEEQAKAKGHAVKIGRSFFKANGKALIYGDVDGLAKVVLDEASGSVLGVHIVGPHATDLIQEGVFAEWVEATNFDMTAVTHPHPTLVEILNDAAMAAEGRTA